MVCHRGKMDSMKISKENKMKEHCTTPSVMRGNKADKPVSHGKTGSQNVDETFSYKLYCVHIDGRIHGIEKDDEPYISESVSDVVSYCMIETYYEL